MSEYFVIDTDCHETVEGGPFDLETAKQVLADAREAYPFEMASNVIKLVKVIGEA
jgi:hypothetical protein